MINTLMMISRPNTVVLFCEIHPTSTKFEHITGTQYLIAKFGYLFKCAFPVKKGLRYF